MRNLNEQDKRDELQQILRELSKSQDVLKEPKDRSNYFLRLETIYYNVGSDNFRHFYTDIFACLTLIDGDPSIGNLDILAQNMQTIKDGYVPKNSDEQDGLIDISKEIIKLYDHTNLEIGRINYTKRMAGETLSELSKAKLMVENLQKKLGESEQVREEVTTRLSEESERLKFEVHDGQKKMQNEYITILGIFASIVLAFTGGMTFSSSVLENIDKASTYRLLAVVFVLGIILINLVWLLIDFLRDINGKSVRKWWLIIIANTVLIVGVIFTFVAYRGQWFELKDTSENQIIQEVPSSPSEDFTKSMEQSIEIQSNTSAGVEIPTP